MTKEATPTTDSTTWDLALTEAEGGWEEVLGVKWEAEVEGVFSQIGDQILEVQEVGEEIVDFEGAHREANLVDFEEDLPWDQEDPQGLIL